HGFPAGRRSGPERGRGARRRHVLAGDAPGRPGTPSAAVLADRAAEFQRPELASHHGRHAAQGGLMPAIQLAPGTMPVTGGWPVPAAGHYLVMPILAGLRRRSAGTRPARLDSHPVTITIDDEHPGPVVPGDFAGLSFERGPLNPGNAGVAGYLFSPGNSSLVTLFRDLGLGSLRVGGGSVDQLIPAGTGSDGFTGIDNLFAFAAAAGVKVIYTFRLLNLSADPIDDLKSINARAAGYIWRNYRDSVDSFAIGNEPDWHAFHTYAGHPLDPAMYEEIPGVPGSAYPSFLANWQSFADALGAAAPGAPLSGA